MNTPWGRADHVHKVADGITSVSTPGHGGYHLDPVRMSAVHARFPHFETFAGGPWFEEDADWAIVALTFEEHFSIEALRSAVRTVKHTVSGRTAEWEQSPYGRGWLDVNHWLYTSGEGQVLCGAVLAWEEQHTTSWERGSMGCGMDDLPPRYWRVAFHRVGNNADRRVVVMPYPEKVFYTQSELDELEWDGENPPPRKPKPQPAMQTFNTFREEECSGAFDGFNITSDADPGL